MDDNNDEIDKILGELKKSSSSNEEKKSPDSEVIHQKKGINDYKEEYEEEEVDYVQNSSKKKIIIAVVAVIAVIAIAAGVYFGLFYNKEEEPAVTATDSQETQTVTQAAPVSTANPLTGESDYNKAAVGKRPVAVVVENSPQARPQYNMDTPDIIFEGEVEGGITRMLWLYADMTDLPEQVGPTRSARPSFVEFSQLFDSIFVHFGESHSKGDYIGADDVIESMGVDNIDGMNTSSCFKRTSDKVSPHNAVLEGENLVAAIENKGYRTDIDNKKFAALNFNEKDTAVSSNSCNSITVKFSSRSTSHTFTYNEEDGVYQNKSDYEQLVSFKNIIVLSADTKYINKENYKGTGKTETYCNFDLTEGTGKLASAGTVTDFNWKVENGVLKFTDANGAELKLNPGKSWIGLASANNGGSAEVTAEAE